MSFQAPLLLGLLAVIPLVAVVYALMQRRRRPYAVRYTNVDLLASVAGRSWSRHVPALFALLALAALLIAVARPQHTVAAERHEATVMLVFDTSGSMLATDVKPRRLAAAQAAARTFTQKVPDDFRLGLIGFGTHASQLVGPTTTIRVGFVLRTRVSMSAKKLFQVAASSFACGSFKISNATLRGAFAKRGATCDQKAPSFARHIATSAEH